MSLKVSFSHPDFPKDQEFAVADVGLIKNGGSVTLTEDQERSFQAARGMSVKEAFKGSQVKVEGTTELKGGES